MPPSDPVALKARMELAVEVLLLRGDGQVALRELMKTLEACRGASVELEAACQAFLSQNLASLGPMDESKERGRRTTSFESQNGQWDEEPRSPTDGSGFLLF